MEQACFCNILNHVYSSVVVVLADGRRAFLTFEAVSIRVTLLVTLRSGNNFKIEDPIHTNSQTPLRGMCESIVMPITRQFIRWMDARSHAIADDSNLPSG